jgi:hypothetical protein
MSEAFFMTIIKGMRSKGETQKAMKEELDGLWADSKRSDLDYSMIYTGFFQQE